MSYQIEAHDELLRRVPRVPSMLKELPDGTLTLTSAVFKTRPGEDGLSVDILALTTMAQAVPNPATHTAALLPAAVPMQEGYECRHNPVPGNNAHALIVGEVDKATSRRFAASARLLL